MIEPERARTSGGIGRARRRRGSRCPALRHRFTCTPLRSGFVTEAGRQQIPLGETMAVTGHRSTASLVGYFREDLATSKGSYFSALDTTEDLESSNAGRDGRFEPEADPWRPSGDSGRANDRGKRMTLRRLCGIVSRWPSVDA